MLKYISLLLLSLTMLYSCTPDQRNAMAPVPMALGNVNDILIVCDQDDWDGPLGDSIRYNFQAPYLILPSPEPVFDLRHFTPQELANQSLRKQLRTYVLIADLSDEDSPTTKLMKQDLFGEKIRRAEEDPSFNTMIGKNKWANGQILVYLFGFGKEALYKNIREKYPTIAKRVNEFDDIQVKNSVYVFGESKTLNKRVRDLINIDMKIPSEYKIVLEESRPDNNISDQNNTEDAVRGIDMLWLRKDTDDALSNILIYSIPYTSKNQFAKESIVDLMNDVGKRYISSTIEGSYMQVNDVDLPIFTTDIQLNNNYAVEVRGIWEMENDFMGGPFISYLIHNEKDGTLVLINGFVYAPSKKKREYMQQLTLILKNTSL